MASSKGLLGIFDAHATYVTDSGLPVASFTSWTSMHTFLGPHFPYISTLPAFRDAFVLFGEQYGNHATKSIISRRETDITVPKSGPPLKQELSMTFHDFHGFLWDYGLVRPVQKYMVNVASRQHVHIAKRYKRELPEITEAHWEHVATLLANALPHGARELEPLTIEDMCTAVGDFVVRSAGVSFDKLLLQEHVAALCQRLEPSMFLARTLCRCDIMIELVGKSLTSQLRMFMHHIDHSLDPPSSDDSTVQTLLQELVETRQSLTKLRDGVARGFVGHVDHSDAHVNPAQITSFIPRKNTVKDLETHRDKTEMLKTASLEWAVRNKIAFKNAPSTLVEAGRVIGLMTHGERSEISDHLEHLVTGVSFGRHLLLLDIALDALLKDEIMKAGSCVRHTYSPQTDITFCNDHQRFLWFSMVCGFLHMF